MATKQEIFKSTLTSKYETKKFVDFIREMITGVRILAPDKENKPYNTFSVFVKQYFHVGEYDDDEGNSIGIFAIELNRGESIERARTAQRSFVKTLLEKGGYSGALVAFYSEGLSVTWRFSFIRMDYEFGKGKIKESLTPAKRYSYLVGQGEPCHTAMDRLLPIFTNDDNAPTLDELEDAFSVETVTKEFFEKYKEKYFEMQEFLEENKDFAEESKRRGFTSEQFTKKLLSQIVFLYFVQKKGWLGVNAIPRVLMESEYKKAFFARGSKSRDLVGKLYVQNERGTYDLDMKQFRSLTVEEEEFFSSFVKGMPWGTGPKDFMRRIYDDCVKRDKNFFDDYLEPLFYTGLNKNRGDNAFFAPLHCRIPFLNGGLFEELDNYDWQNNDFAIPNEMFSNKDIKGRDADGILDIFDRYNFTMAEDEPMEREVAVDPEMLGKVFENLLEVKNRKSKGAFYTPREIVHYMSQESLINYLVTRTGIPEDDVRKLILYGEYFKDKDAEKTKKVPNKNGSGYHMELDKEKEFEIPASIFSYKDNVNRLQELDDLLANIKVVDPAVGSGAFPLGMLNEIVKARDTLTTYLTIEMHSYDKKVLFASGYIGSRNIYDLKSETIKNCIFACDIEPSATDIAKLRLWLSLVIEDELSDEKQDGGLMGQHSKPKQLPNLDCNIICGNSLIDSFEGIDLISNSDVLKNITGEHQENMMQSGVDKMIETLISLQDKLFYTKEHVEKIETKSQIQSIYDAIIEKQLAVNPELLQKYRESLIETSRPFVLWQLYFPKVFKENGGFDICIGNPPYIGEEGNKELFQAISKTNFGSKYYVGKMDFWYFFTSKGLELLCNGGGLSFIAPNNWMTTAGGKKMRKHIAEEGKILKFVNFNNVMIFESASQQTMIFLIQKKTQTSPYLLQYKAVGSRSLNSYELVKFLNSNDIGESYLSEFNPSNHLDGKEIQFLSAEILRIVNKIKEGERYYLTNDEVLNGIHPHHASVTKKMLDRLDNASVGDGIFVLKDDEVNELSLNDAENNLLQPYYDTENISRYYFNSNGNRKIIYTTSEFRDVSLMKDYPNIKAHLDKYVNVITSDNRPYGLHRARKKEFFDNPKIVSLRKCSVPTFSYIDVPAYVTAEWYMIMTSRIDMEYLTCLFNSELIKFWLLKTGKMQGSIYQIDKNPLINIPIAVPSAENMDRIKILCSQIRKIRISKAADISDIEKEIDSIIFDTYNFDKKDISYIEQIIRNWENK